MIPVRSIVRFGLGLLVLATGCNNGLPAAAPTVDSPLAQAGRGATSCDSSPVATTTQTSSLELRAGAASTAASIVPASAWMTADNVACPSALAANDGACKQMLPGSYAIELDLDVYWLDEVNTSAPRFDPGRGKLSVLLKSQLSQFCQDGSAGQASLQACGMRFPAIYADASGEVTQLVVSDAAWDSADAPSFKSLAHTTGFTAADRVFIDPVTSLFGIDLLDVDAPWPSYDETPFVSCANGEGAVCFPDQDRDAHPGITVRLQRDGVPSGAGYARCGGWHYAPLATDPSASSFEYGATALYLGLRTELGGARTFGAGCAGGDGAADTHDVELRVLDCALQDGSPCTATAATFVDQNVPSFHVLAQGEAPPLHWKHPRADADAQLDRSVSAGPQNHVIRVGDLDDDPSCAQARDAFGVATN